MNPWNLIGWIIVIFLIIAFMPVVLEKSSLSFVVNFPSHLLSRYRSARRYKLASAGRLSCEHQRSSDKGPCGRIATRRTPRGYFCEIHWGFNNRMFAGDLGSSVSYAVPLDHVKQSEISVREYDS